MKKKLCVYLDQFAISDLLDAQIDETWSTIRDLLRKGYEDDLLFCPLSLEHYIETSKKHFEGAIEHDLFLKNLSDGYILKQENFITSQLISSLIRGNNITINTYCHSGKEVFFDQEENFNRIKNANDEYREMVGGIADELNEFRSSTNNQRLKKNQKNELFQSVKKLQARPFIDRLVNLRDNKKLTVRGEKIGTMEVPNWIDTIIHRLLTKHKFTELEIKELIKEFQENDFDNVPTLDIRSAMEAISAVYSKKTTHNDRIDLMRIINGFPMSDIFLTDKKRKREIIEIGLDKKYKTKVFCGTNEDLLNLVTELKNIQH